MNWQKRVGGWRHNANWFCIKKPILPQGKKTSINHLEPLPGELDIVKSIFKMFLEKRSIQGVVNHMKKSGIKTKNGFNHTRTSIKDILTNPVYAIADEDTYLFLNPLMYRFMQKI